MLLPIKDIISAGFVLMDLWIVWKLYILVCSIAISNNVVVMNTEKCCKCVISSTGGSENSSRSEWSWTIVSLFLQRYTRWVGSLFAWPWPLELAWLLVPSKEARWLSLSDSAASVGWSSETLLRVLHLRSHRFLPHPN